MNPTPRKIWIVSELYYPEETSTGYFMTGIAEGLAQHYKVGALCSRPTYAARGQHAPASEVHNGVKIYRCTAAAFNKDSLPLRVINLLTITLTLFFRALSVFARNDIVLVVTNPPLLPFLTMAACRLKGARCLLLVHDVYPEVLIATGLIKKQSLPARLIDRLSLFLYRSVNRIIVLGRDMKELIEKKLGHSDSRVVIIENWGDVQNIVPQPRERNSLLQQLGLAKKFVIQYSGNIGRTHGIENLIDAAKALKNHDDIVFLIIGSGMKKRLLEQTVRQEKLTNIIVLPRRPRDQLAASLNACDLAIITFIPAMAGVSVPSRLYNILAAGKPILAVAEDRSELAMVVKEENVGWVVQPGKSDQLTQAILEAKSSPDLPAKMAANARSAAEKKYSYSPIIERYKTLIEQLQ